MSQRQWTITVPITDNDGMRINPGHWSELEMRLLAVAGGFSQTTIEGKWKNDDGKVFGDTSIRYEILTDNGHGTVDKQITEIADFVKASWQQESVLITETETRFQFV